MSEERDEPNCCKHLPSLSVQELSSNVGDLMTPTSHSPSFYDEIFDEKQFNDLISDPLLNTGQMEIQKRGNDPLLNTGQTENQNRGNENSQPTANLPTNGNGNGNNSLPSQMINTGLENGSNGSNIWNGNGNGNYRNDLADFFDFGPETSGQRQSQLQPQAQPQPQIPASQVMTPMWQNGQPMATAPTQPIGQMASGSGMVQGTTQKKSAPYVRVKVEPQDSYISSAEQDRDEFNFSAGSHPSSVTRGAMYAREYRKKNKSRVSKLEADNERLWRENAALKEAYNEACAKANSLGREVTYLRQVLANDSAISNLLNAVVSNTTGLKFQWPLVSGGDKPEGKPAAGPSGSKRRVPDGGDQGTVLKQRKLGENEGRGQQKTSESPGVCLHVNNDMVSVEFCPRCNRDAKRGCGDLQQ